MNGKHLNALANLRFNRASGNVHVAVLFGRDPDQGIGVFDNVTHAVAPVRLVD